MNTAPSMVRANTLLLLAALLLLALRAAAGGRYAVKYRETADKAGLVSQLEEAGYRVVQDFDRWVARQRTPGKA